MTGSRLRLTLVLAGIALGGLVLLSWTQTWFEVTLTTGFRLDVSGQQAVPALSALAFAALALSAALTIARRGLRVALGVLQLVLGGVVVVVAVLAVGDPVAASSSVITDATAVSGRDSILALVLAVSPTPFPYVAIGAGALLALAGLAVALTAARWPGATRRYDADRDTGTRSGAWDALSDGSDPTR